MKPPLLFLAHLPPFPATGGGQVRSLATLENLAGRFTVTLVTFRRPGLDPATLAPLETLCVGGIHTVPLPRSRFRDSLCVAGGWFSPQPWRIQRDYRGSMQSLVADLVARTPFRAIHVDHLPMVPYAVSLPESTDIRRVLDCHNAEHRLFDSMARFAKWPVNCLLRKDARRLADVTRGILPRMDAVVTVTEEDAAAMRDLDPTFESHIHVVPVGISIPEHALAVPQADGNRIATVATLDWLPNTEGLLWFAESVWPIVRARHPEWIWDIAGVRANRQARRLARIPGIRFHGAVASVGAFLEGASVFVAPVRCGAGIRIKVLDAMARGIPVVTSSLGAEGIAPDIPCVIADTPAEFVDALDRLLPDLAARRCLASHGRIAVERHHGVVPARNAWQAVYDSVLGTEAHAR